MKLISYLQLFLIACVFGFFIWLTNQYFAEIKKDQFTIRKNKIETISSQLTISNSEFLPVTDILGYRVLLTKKASKGGYDLEVHQRSGTKIIINQDPVNIDFAPTISKDGLHVLYVSNQFLYHWFEGGGVTKLPYTLFSGLWDIVSINNRQFLFVPKDEQSSFKGECEGDCSGAIILTILYERQGDSLISGSNKIELSYKFSDYNNSSVNLEDINLDGQTDFILYQQTVAAPIWRIAETTGFDASSKKVTNKSFSYLSFQIGRSASYPVAADYNGDGVLDIATFKVPGKQNKKETLYNWEIFYSQNLGIGDSVYFLKDVESKKYFWGNFPGDIPVPADYDCDKKTDIAVYNPHRGLWEIMLSSGGFNQHKASKYYPGFAIKKEWGRGIPVVGDYDGDNCADLAVWEVPKEGYGIWRVMYVDRFGNKRRSRVLHFGKRGDIPMPADYNGDGKTDIAVYRPSTLQWIIRYSKNNIVKHTWGYPNMENPIAKDFDGDLKADFAFYSDTFDKNNWLILPSSRNSKALDVTLNGQGLVASFDFGYPNAFPQEVWLNKAARRVYQ